MKHWPICAQIGALHGMIVGFMFAATNCCAPMSMQDVVWTVLLGAALSALISLFLLIVIRRYGAGSVLWQTLLNALLVSLVVVLVLYAIGPHPLIALLGLVAGFILGALIGFLLCRLCGLRAIPGTGTGRQP